MFSLIITQPYIFAVTAPVSDSTDQVRAAYEELLEKSSSQSDGAIQFESLIVWENGEATISYWVAAGDSLSSIAKSFWTSVEAIMDANGISDANLVRPGQKLVIAYDEWVIVNIKETMDIEQFSNKYDIDKEEFLSMNYFEDTNTTLEQGWQVFVPLNQVEAEKKGLIDKEAFVELDLPVPDPVLEEQLVITDPLPTRADDTTLTEENNIPQVQDNNVYEQTVITAEETQQHLNNLELAKLEAQQAAEEAKKQAEIQAAKAKEAQRQAEIAKTRKAQEAAAAAQRAAAAAQQAAEQQAQRALDAAKAQAVAQEAQPIQCSSNQCAHKWRCWTPPTNAQCAPNDNNNAWVCKAWFTEYGNNCISSDSAITQAPTKSPTVLAQWYFNPHKVDSSVYGWGPGHCTAMAAHLWKVNHGIRIRDYWTGNAKDWIVNAKNAWFRVDSTPAAGSLMVSGYGYWGWWPYGHVMYVESVDYANGLVTVVDMNYKWRYIATKRTEAINKARGFIHPK